MALARAIVREPAVFLLDEPLSNLDAKLRVQTRATSSSSFQRRLRTTTIYVTHDQVEAMALGDRIAVMNKGRLRQLGPPQESLRRAGRHLRGELPRLAADEPRSSATGCLVGLPARADAARGRVPTPGAAGARLVPRRSRGEPRRRPLLYGVLRDPAPDAKMIINLPFTVPLAGRAEGRRTSSTSSTNDLKFFDKRERAARGVEALPRAASTSDTALGEGPRCATRAASTSAR